MGISGAWLRSVSIVEAADLAALPRMADRTPRVPFMRHYTGLGAINRYNLHRHSRIRDRAVQPASVI